MRSEKENHRDREREEREIEKELERETERQRKQLYVGGTCRSPSHAQFCNVISTALSSQHCQVTQSTELKIAPEDPGF